MKYPSRRKKFFFLLVAFTLSSLAAPVLAQDGLVVEKNGKRVDIGGLLSGRGLIVENENKGKSAQIFGDGGMELENQRNKAQIDMDSRGNALAVESTRNSNVQSSGSKVIELNSGTGVISANGNKVVLDGAGGVAVQSGKGNQVQIGWRDRESSTGVVYDEAEVFRELRIEKTDTELKTNLPGDILFAFNSDQLREEATESLAKVAFVARKNLKGNIVVEGHTDSVGSDEANRALSERRALSVMRWLREKEGIPAENLKGYGFGESRPKFHNTTPDGSDDEVGRAQNRRVEIRIETE